MQQIWAELMDALEPSEIDWIFRHGREERIEAGTLLVEEDGTVDAIYFLVEGLLHARTRALGLLAVLGPGEVVGEISFIDRQRASASVEAAEDGMVLVLPRDVLEPELLANVAFAANFYRALAGIACRRLRATSLRLGGGGAPGSAEDVEEASVESDVDVAVERLKRSLIHADEALSLNDGTIPDAVALKVRQEVQSFARLLNDTIGELLDPPSALNQQIGRRVQRELLPYVSQTRLGERLFKKPRGYGGDFSALELIYDHAPEGEGPLGGLLDRCLHEMPAIAALRSRRWLLTREIQKTLLQRAGEAEPARVMSIACGPATEVFDAFASLDEPSLLASTLVDVDFQALIHIGERARQLGLSEQITMTVKNLVYLALGKTKLEAPAQDLIYSIGLIDYFNDNMVVRIIDHIHAVLRPGGRVILGNFHPRNPSKAFLDYVLEWPLIHRSAGDMDRLFERSAFGRGTTSVRFDEQEVYLFGECVKEE